MKLLIRICGGDEEKKSTEQFEKEKKTIRSGFLIRSGTGCGDNERSTSKEVTANFGSRGLFPFKSGSPRTPWPYFNIEHFILKKKPHQFDVTYNNKHDLQHHFKFTDNYVLLYYVFFARLCNAFVLKIVAADYTSFFAECTHSFQRHKQFVIGYEFID